LSSTLDANNFYSLSPLFVNEAAVPLARDAPPLMRPYSFQASRNRKEARVPFGARRERGKKDNNLFCSFALVDASTLLRVFQEFFVADSSHLAHRSAEDIEKQAFHLENERK
jgi:hypothetical protein